MIVKPKVAAPIAKNTLVQKSVVGKVVAKKSVKPLVKKSAVGLAQLNTDSESLNGAGSNILDQFGPESMNNLLQTTGKLHHLYKTIGEPKEKQVEMLAQQYGIEMDNNMK